MGKKGTPKDIHFTPHLNFKVDHKPNVLPNRHLMICKCLAQPFSHTFYHTGKHAWALHVLSLVSHSRNQDRHWILSAQEMWLSGQIISQFLESKITFDHFHIKVETLTTTLPKIEQNCRSTFCQHKTIKSHNQFFSSYFL